MSGMARTRTLWSISSRIEEALITWRSPKGIILGEYDVIVEGEGESLDDRKSIPEILEDRGLDPKLVSSLITGPDASGTERSLLSWSEGQSDFSGEDRTLALLVHGPVDCDQLDYLLRDSHFTGVKHGVVDHNRLIECLRSQSGDIVVEQGGYLLWKGC